MRLNSALRASTVGILCLAVASACNSDKAAKLKDLNLAPGVLDKPPIIESIGSSAVLTFSPDSDLEIPVEYTDDAEKLSWEVQITGVVPLNGQFQAPDLNHFTDANSQVPNQKYHRTIRINKEYFQDNRIQSGDRITVFVDLYDRSSPQYVAVSARVKHLNTAITDKAAAEEDAALKEAALQTAKDTAARDKSDAEKARADKTADDKATADKNAAEKATAAKVAAATQQAQKLDERLKAANDKAAASEKAVEAAQSANDLANAEVSQKNATEAAAVMELAAYLYSIKKIDADSLEMYKKSHGPMEIGELLRYASELLSQRVAQASRQFVLMSVSDYRAKYASSRIAPQDIAAFPLPEKEAQALFGTTISERFYVVELTIRNDSNETKLISTGMVQAYGRASVNLQHSYVDIDVQILKHKTSVDIRQYTIPITIAPISSEHAYTIAKDQAQYRPREWIFRGLEFTGLLATAVVNGFYPGSQNALRATGIFGNAVIPGGKTLWPDPTPANLKNIVDYSMPEVVRIPPNTILGHKYLYFAKDNIQGILSNPPTNSIHFDGKEFLADLNDSPVKVIYLSFDTLEVPFENAVSPAEDSLETKTFKAVTRIDNLLAWSDRFVIPFETKTGKFAASDLPADQSRGLTAEDILRLKNDAKIGDKDALAAALKTMDSTDHADSAAALASEFSQWLGVLDAFDPADVLEKSEVSHTKMLANLPILKQRMVDIQSQIRSGKDSLQYSADVTDVLKTIDQVELYRNIYIQASAGLHTLSAALDPTLVTADATTHTLTFNKTLSPHILKNLEDTRIQLATIRNNILIARGNSTLFPTLKSDPKPTTATTQAATTQAATTQAATTQAATNAATTPTATAPALGSTH